MADLSRRLALDYTWIYKPEDVISIFEKFFDLGKINQAVCKGYSVTHSTYLLDDWSQKGTEKILAIAYMCANNVLPMLLCLNKELEKSVDSESLDETKKEEIMAELLYIIKFFIIDVFVALENYYEKPKKFLRRINLIRDRIAKDYYWNNDLINLDKQILHVLNEFNYKR